MKKITAFFLIILLLISMGGCTKSTPEQKLYKASEVVVNKYESYCEEQPKDVTISKKGNSYFFKGYQIEVPEKSDMEKSSYNDDDAKEIPISLEKKFQKAKEKVYQFIDTTSVFESKEELKEYIQNIPMFYTVFSKEDKEHGYTAFYQEGKVYVDASKMDISICIFVHELFHALSAYLRGTDESKTSGRMIDETFTDLCMRCVCNPKPQEQSIYTLYYDGAYALVYAFGAEDAFKAYFYDKWSEIGEKHGISTAEMELYTASLDIYLDGYPVAEDVVKTYICKCINIGK